MHMLMQLEKKQKKWSENAIEDGEKDDVVVEVELEKDERRWRGQCPQTW
jgi:hypothetical protein